MTVLLRSQADAYLLSVWYLDFPDLWYRVNSDPKVRPDFPRTMVERNEAYLKYNQSLTDRRNPESLESVLPNPR